MESQTWVGNASTSRDWWRGDRQQGTTGAGESNCNRTDMRIRACERAYVYVYVNVIRILTAGLYLQHQTFRCLSITPQKKSNLHN